jgi:mono/diheme cytochrome c family protein
MRSIVLAIAFAVTVAAVAAISVAVAAEGDTAASLQRGQVLLTQYCARCHAVGRNGVSQHPPAPAFRTLGQRYPVESLEESLAEGIISGHPDMPEFTFEPSEIGDIIAYLKSIQVP